MREHLIPFGLVDEKTMKRGGTMKKDLLYEDSDGWSRYVSTEETEEPMTLDEYKKQEELWESIGEPMTQEELDELHCVEEDLDEIDEIYDCGYKSGRREGFDEGYGCGYEEAKEYNVILDGEILDEIADFKKKILSYRKQPWEENAEHNHMIFEIHKGLIELTETLVMNQVWDYWHRREEEIENG